MSATSSISAWTCTTCPGKDESAEQNHSSRSAKGNKYLRLLNRRARCRQEQRQLFSGSVLASAAAAGLSVCLGHRPSALPCGLEDLA
jgi:hypothetical protein